MRKFNGAVPPSPSLVVCKCFWNLSQAQGKFCNSSERKKTVVFFFFFPLYKDWAILKFLLLSVIKKSLRAELNQLLRWFSGLGIIFWLLRLLFLGFGWILQILHLSVVLAAEGVALKIISISGAICLLLGLTLIAWMVTGVCVHKASFTLRPLWDASDSVMVLFLLLFQPKERRHPCDLKVIKSVFRAYFMN